MKTPMAPQYYDTLFNVIDDYKAHYRDSRYFVLWTQIIQFLRKIPNPRILEIGCGPGQFAHYLWDQGFRDYHGFDFSPEAVRIAKTVVPQSFDVGDALKAESFRYEYNVAIVLEVLEHVDDDLGVLANIRPGTTILFSLPTFDDEAHVRWFTSQQDIVNRYNGSVDLRQIILLNHWFVCAGVVRDRLAAPKMSAMDLLALVQQKLLKDC